MIRYHIGMLDFDYNRPAEQLQQSHSLPSMLPEEQPPKAYVLLNAGLHPHDFHSPTTRKSVVDALQEQQLYGTWKTTTYTKVHVLQEQQRTGMIANSVPVDEIMTEQDVQQNEKHNVTSTSISDTLMCEALFPHVCFNLSWILQLRSPISHYYVDNLHFMEPIYRIMNEEYLQQLALLPQPPDHDSATTSSGSTYYSPINRSHITIHP